MAQMGDTRAKTEANYANSKLTDEERKFFSGISGVKYVVMLAENWCGERAPQLAPDRPTSSRRCRGPSCAVFLPRSERGTCATPSSTTVTSPFRWWSLRQGLERDRSLARARTRRDYRGLRDPRPHPRRGAPGCVQGAAGRGDERVRAQVQAE